MSIRENKGNAPENFEIPNCTIEDVDRSVFTLFDKQLPFNYKHKEGIKKAPVIFATGERFAVLRRKEPLRDKSGALVLPLISIMRTGISQAPTMGAGTSQNVPMTIRKRLSPEDPVYQRLINKSGIKNSDDLVSNLAKTTDITGSMPGRVATRRASPPTPLSTREGEVLNTTLGNNIFEVITMPPPKYYTATYEVTFWAQYTTQMNDMIMAMMSLYQSYSQRSFKLETPKGYWFVGYVAEALTPGNNFDDFTDSERLVRYSFELTVPAYIVGSAYRGAENRLRKFISAPQISFDSDVFTDSYVQQAPANIASGDPKSYILDDMRTIDRNLPGQAIANTQGKIGGMSIANVGGTTTDSDTEVFEITKDPFTGKTIRKKVLVKTRLRRSGETVLKETIG
tara:strand:- start:22132 stop:23322 length:1191 start_codon:yes stop_codon:yes gene_type:complete